MLPTFPLFCENLCQEQVPSGYKSGCSLKKAYNPLVGDVTKMRVFTVSFVEVFAEEAKCGQYESCSDFVAWNNFSSD